MPLEPLKLARLIAVVRKETGRDFDKAAVLQTLGTLSEALSVALLVPLLQLLREGDGGAAIRIGEDRYELSLTGVLVGFVILIVARSISLEYKERFNARVTFGFAERMTARLFSTVAAAQWSTVSRWRTADMTRTVTGDGDRLLHTINLLLGFVQTVAVTAILSGLSLLLSWQMTLVALAVGGAMLAVTTPARKRALSRGRQLVEARQEQHRITDEFFNGLRTAKAFGLEAAHVAAMDSVLERIRRSNEAFMTSRARTTTIYQTATALALAGFIYASLQLADQGLEQTIALLFLYMRLAPRIVALHMGAQELHLQMAGAEATLAMLDEAERDSAPAPRVSGTPFRLDREIVLQGVEFRYPDSEAAAVHDVSVRIPARQITALVGPTGSGKSTLVDIILGLLIPQAGQVLVDGTVLTGEMLADWRQRIGYVPQETYLFNGTIAQNLRLGQAEATEADLWEALETADAADFVRALPAGLDHYVGDRGRSLSGGERQRVAIARALLRRPALLILDEATAALDADTQRRVIQGICDLRSNMTVIAVAHRAAVVAFADHVLRLENGGIREHGTASHPADLAV